MEFWDGACGIAGTGLQDPDDSSDESYERPRQHYDIHPEIQERIVIGLAKTSNAREENNAYQYRWTQQKFSNK
eukprot:2384859-Amphidinium_carterae.1